MKTVLCSWLLIVMTGMAVLAATNEVPTMAEQEQMFMEAVMLRQQGFYAEAETRLKRLSELQTDQPTIKQMLAEVQQLRDQQGDPARELKRKLSQLIVPEVNFRDVEPKDVFEFLRKESKKLTPDKSEVNFAWLVPADEKLPRVTLSLRKVPFLDVVRYTAEAAKLRYRVDSHAVVIYKEQPAPAPTPESHDKSE
jgi:vancomycin resistance protein YoaR